MLRTVTLPLILVTLIGMTGCQSPETFNQSLSHAARDISQGHLEAARSSLDQAGSLASDSRQAQKVADLTAIIDGAEAMIDGRPEGAAEAWARVEDPDLRVQIRREASALGLQMHTRRQEYTP